MYQPGTYPFDLLTPATIIWQPLLVQSMEPLQGERLHQDPKDTVRTVWLICHPAVHDDALAALQQTASLTLSAIKRQEATANAEYAVEIADLRGHFNTFEIIGPKSNQVLKGALKPIPQDDRASFAQVSGWIDGTGRCDTHLN